MAGRLPKYREFLHVLKDLANKESLGEFSLAIGKSAANVSQYLNGHKTVGKHTLRSAVYHLGEWSVKPIVEVQPIPKPLSSLPTTPGIYAFYDSSASIIYLGQAKNLQAEITSALNRPATFPVRKGPKLSNRNYPKYRALTTYLSAYEVESPRLRHNLEALLLRVFPNQGHNNKLGKFR